MSKCFFDRKAIQSASAIAILKNGKMVGRILVSWADSRIWGANPTAFFQLYDHGSGTSKSIGGCGYCKESTAIFQAMRVFNSKYPDILSGIEKEHLEGTGVESIRTYIESIGYSWESIL